MDMIATNVHVYNLEEAIRYSKFPMSVDTDKCSTMVTKTVDMLANAAPGTGHNSFLKSVLVSAEIEVSVKLLVQLERYHFIEIGSSQSTMHRIAKMDFDKCFEEHTDKVILERLKELKDIYLETGDKEDYLNLLYSCPMGIKLKMGITTNYLQLKVLYNQRFQHRLPEWQMLCEQMKQLPYSEWITGKEDKEA